MKLPLTIVLVAALIKVSTGWDIGKSFVDGLSQITTKIAGAEFNGNIRKTGSDSANSACHGVVGFVKLNPYTPNIENVSFQLRTPCGRKELPISETGKFRDAPEFDVNKKTVVFVTGWKVGPDKSYVDDMAKAYHCRGGYNFVIVNTGEYIQGEYANSAYHTAKLGEFVAVGLQNLGIPVEKIHIIGHSLGAQIVGSAGRHFHNLTGQKLVRITGLDPARPCFVGDVAFPRISQGDADFVDIIHSNPHDLGTEEQIGDVDFYPGGLDVLKSGCENGIIECSHELAIQYYAESVYPDNENSFMGKSCSDYSDLERKSCNGPTSPMGYATDASSKGIHYLSVRDSSPYGNDARTVTNFVSNVCGLCP